MPVWNRYLGTPVISFIGRVRSKTKIGDFNCGLRGYNTEKINSLNCKCEGMEYATEMILRAGKAKLKIKEVPINFYKDKRNKPPHLRPIKDGIRHLKMLFNKL